MLDPGAAPAGTRRALPPPAAASVALALPGEPRLRVRIGRGTVPGRGSLAGL
ncbi:MAG TPA: hypothetical protein VE997_03710 [Candidatus Limnocylindria bacterium]|nr:hypothetical protein [Candidatus Limnocylindria bacterium]